MTYSPTQTTPYKQLRRSRTDKMLGGVCGGFARYFGIDPVAARVLFVLLAFVSGGALVLAYLAFWILMPEEPVAGAWPTATPPTAAPMPPTD